MGRLLLLTVVVLPLPCVLASQDTSSVVELPEADRRILDQYLGPDVIGGKALN